MIEFAKLPPNERVVYFQQAAEKSDLPAHLVEKDFWVCFALQQLYSSSEIAKYLTFKGGTSLSKVFKAIDRFSEDIDFAVSRECLGFGGEAAPDADGISGKERRRRLEELSAACRSWVNNELKPKLTNQLTSALGTGNWNVDLIEDQSKNQQILFHYPQSKLTQSGSYNPPQVRIELTARTDNHPSQTAQIKSIVAEQFPVSISDSVVQVEVLKVERTFWEKATILHQFHFQDDPTRVARGFSRHYYDIYQLCERGYLESALSEIGLLTEVAVHKDIFYRQNWARFDLARNPKTLELLPHLSIERVISNDYSDMREMIFGAPPTFEQILEQLNQLKSRINAAGA